MKNTVVVICMLYSFISLLQWVDYEEISVIHPILVIILGAVILLNGASIKNENYYNTPWLNRKNWIIFHNNTINNEFDEKIIKQYKNYNTIKVNG